MDLIPPLVIGVLAILQLLTSLWGMYWWLVAHGFAPHPEDRHG